MRRLRVNAKRLTSISPILNAKLDARYTPPQLVLLVERTPDLDEFRFENKQGVWYAEKAGFVKYYYWIGPNNAGGFSNTHIPIITKNNTRVILKGPWSSRAGAVNSVGFGPCVDVLLAEDPEAFSRGYTYSSGAVTLEMAMRACVIIGKMRMVKIRDDSDVRYDPFREK